MIHVLRVSLLISILLLRPHVIAIPYVDLNKSDNIVPNHGMFLLREPVAGMTTSDAYCQYAYKPWWTHYQQQIRAAIMSDSRTRDWYMRLEFTRYPSMDLAIGNQPAIFRPEVPVESIMGENFAPLHIHRPEGIVMKDAAWRGKGGLWGCLLACQDLQKSIELPIASLIFAARHVRTRWPFVYNCPEGYVSLVLWQASIRERETLQETKRAEELWTTVPLKHRSDDPMTHFGDHGREVEKCNCVPTTEVTQKLALQQIKARLGTLSVRSAVQRPNKTPRSSTPRKKKVIATSTPVPSSENEEAESSDAAAKRQRLDNSGGIDDRQAQVNAHLDDYQVLDDITCWDFDYPEVDVALPGTVAQQNQAPPAAEDADFHDVLSATLAAFAGFEGQDTAWDVLGRPSDPGPAKGHRR